LRINKQFLFITILIVTWAVSVIARLKFNGLSYGFDYGLYQPDGMHYTFRTLTFLGNSELTSAQMVSDWYATHGFKLSQINPSDLLPENNRVWGVISPRILYPLLSVPFVAVFGITGMIAISAISFLVLLLTIYSLGRKFGQESLAMVIAFLLTASVTTTRWMISNCTDALLVAVTCCAVLILVSEFSENQKAILLSAVGTLGVLTRFSLPIWVAIAFVLFALRKIKLGAFLLISASLATIPTFLSQPNDAVLPGTVNLSGFEKFVALPQSFVKVAFIEIAQLAALDRILLLFLLTSFFIAVLKAREIENRYFLSVAFAVFGIGAINGVLGVNFRYQLPLIPFMAWTVLAFSSRIKSKNSLGSFPKQNPHADS
jgi:hypothetical protein